jgi:hypothetical protein
MDRKEVRYYLARLRWGHRTIKQHIDQMEDIITNINKLLDEEASP